MKSCLVAMLSLTLFLLFGCGGASTSQATPSTLPIFVTSTDQSSSYEHIWVKIFQIELTSGAGNQLVFESPAGLVVDIAKLYETDFLYRFLGTVEIPASLFTGAKVTLGQNVTLFPIGSQTGIEGSFAPEFDQDNFTVVETTFSAPIATASPIVLGFDLSQVVGAEVTPQVEIHSGQGIEDISRQPTSVVKGNVTESDGGFRLRALGQSDFSFVVDSTTRVYNLNGSSSPMILEGRIVELQGQYSVLDGAFHARSVAIQEDPGVEESGLVVGNSTSVNGSTGSFRIGTDTIRAFLPKLSFIEIAARDQTVFVNDSGLVIGRRLFFDTLIANPNRVVSAQGTYDQSGNRLLPVLLRIDLPLNQPIVMVKGTCANIKSGSGTIEIELAQWNGFSNTKEALITVVAQGGAIYRNETHALITREQFFTQLEQGQGIEVLGTPISEQLSATELQLKGDLFIGSDPHEASGNILSTSFATRSFTVSIYEWFGFDADHGDSMMVHTNLQTNFTDDQGNPMTENEFYNQLEIGGSAVVEGLFSQGEFNATYCRLGS